jgi:hypothetical protein
MVFETRLGGDTTVEHHSAEYPHARIEVAYGAPSRRFVAVRVG